LEDAKAEDIVTIDLDGKTTIADFMVVASGRSTRQVDAAADRVVESLKANGTPALSVEGRQNCDWVLIDGRDVIVHIFRPEVRDLYNLEKMWAVDLIGLADERTDLATD
jgi:ribosome-associated protein